MTPRGRRSHRLALKLGLLLGLAVLRLNAWAQPKTVSKKSGFESVQVTFRLLNRSMPPAGASEDDGVRLLLHYLDRRSSYLISVNRRDNRVEMVKRAQGRDHVLIASSFEVPFGRWQDVRATAKNNGDGSVGLELFVDGRLLAGATDRGTVGGPPIRPAGSVSLDGENDDFQVEGFAVLPLAAAGPGPAQVVLTAPAPGTRLSGQVVLTAEARQGSLPAGVEFQVDGRALAAEDVLAPFTAPWNTALVDNGSHLLTVVSRDAGGRRRVSPATLVIVENALQAAQAAADVAVVQEADGKSAALKWLTEEPATAQVEYGRTDRYGLETAFEFLPKREHSALLTGLVPGSEYHYRIRLRAASGEVAVSPDFSFSTPPDAASPQAGAEGGDGAAAGVTAGDGAPAQGLGGDGAAAGGMDSAPAAAGGDDARAREKFLTPASVDGVNDVATFGAAAREVSIFNMRGRKVFSAVRAGAPLTWNGRDDSGVIVESGVYIVKIRKDDEGQVYQSFAVVK